MIIIIVYLLSYLIFNTFLDRKRICLKTLYTSPLRHPETTYPYIRRKFCDILLYYIIYYNEDMCPMCESLFRSLLCVSLYRFKH